MPLINTMAVLSVSHKKMVKNVKNFAQRGGGGRLAPFNKLCKYGFISS